MPKTSKVLDFLTVQVQESKLIQLIPGLHLETGPDFAKSAAALCCEQGLSGKMKLTSWDKSYYRTYYNRTAIQLNYEKIHKHLWTISMKYHWTLVLSSCSHFLGLQEPLQQSASFSGSGSSFTWNKVLVRSTMELLSSAQQILQPKRRQLAPGSYIEIPISPCLPSIAGRTLVREPFPHLWISWCFIVFVHCSLRFGSCNIVPQGKKRGACWDRTLGKVEAGAGPPLRPDQCRKTLALVALTPGLLAITICYLPPVRVTISWCERRVIPKSPTTSGFSVTSTTTTRIVRSKCRAAAASCSLNHAGRFRLQCKGECLSDSQHRMTSMSWIWGTVDFALPQKTPVVALQCPYQASMLR